MQQNKTRRRSRDGILCKGRKRRGEKITESHMKNILLRQFWVIFSTSSSAVLICSFLMSRARCAFTDRMCSRDTCMTRRRRKKLLTKMDGFTRGTLENGNQWVCFLFGDKIPHITFSTKSTELTAILQAKANPHNLNRRPFALRQHFLLSKARLVAILDSTRF